MVEIYQVPDIHVFIPLQWELPIGETKFSNFPQHCSLPPCSAPLDLLDLILAPASNPDTYNLHIDKRVLPTRHITHVTHTCCVWPHVSQHVIKLKSNVRIGQQQMSCQITEKNTWFVGYYTGSGDVYNCISSCCGPPFVYKKLLWAPLSTS